MTTRRIIQEDAESPGHALRVYAFVSLILAALVRLTTRRDGFWESVCLCACVPGLVVYCHYYVSATHGHLRWSFRLRLSAVATFACAIMLSHGGLKSRSLDIGSAIFYGIAGGLGAYIIAMMTAGVADLILDRLRMFAQPGKCHTCGYNLKGNTSGRCPECGTEIDLYVRLSKQACTDSMVHSECDHEKRKV